MCEPPPRQIIITATPTEATAYDSPPQDPSPRPLPLAHRSMGARGLERSFLVRLAVCAAAGRGLMHTLLLIILITLTAYLVISWTEE